MILTIAMSDAYGAGFEFSDHEYIQKNHCLTKYYSPEFDNKPAGCYTDDTQMTIAIVELMINKDGPWSKLLVAEYFLQAFKRDPRSSYSPDFYEFLLSTKSASEFIEKINAYSIRNGSAMRSVPLGLIKDKTEMLEKARIQAIVTHDTYEGIVASQVVALCVFYFVNNLGNKAGLFEYIYQESNELFRQDKTTPTECDAIDTIDAVLTVLYKSSTLTQVLDNAINLGGDTDSVATIACGIAFFSDEFVKDLPEFLERDLENGTYGKDYLVDLNAKLKSNYISIKSLSNE